MSDTPLTDAAWECNDECTTRVVALRMRRHAMQMERDRAELLDVLTAIAGGPVQRVSQDLHNRARAAIAKATNQKP